MPRAPSPQHVTNRSLNRALRTAYATFARSYTRAASGDAYFARPFGGYRDTGDQRLQLRMLVGYSAQRPGIKTLLQRAFDAANMGQVSTFRDNAPN
jgi:hypothetical protein